MFTIGDCSKSEPAGEVKKMVGKPFTFVVSCPNWLSIDRS
jgi:hypothetical protein